MPSFTWAIVLPAVNYAIFNFSSQSNTAPLAKPSSFLRQDDSRSGTFYKYHFIFLVEITFCCSAVQTTTID
jgi:hypothetical protein